jgi:nitrogen fixation NifU-like protein
MAVPPKPIVATQDQFGREALLDHARSPYHHGSCHRATHRGSFANPSCGDFAQVELGVDSTGRIVEAWFESEGCMITRAGGSILMEWLEGKSIEEAKQLRELDILNLLESPMTPRRQACLLMT